MPPAWQRVCGCFEVRLVKAFLRAFEVRLACSMAGPFVRRGTAMACVLCMALHPLMRWAAVCPLISVRFLIR